MKIDFFELLIRFKMWRKKPLHIHDALKETNFETVAFLSNTAIGDTLFNTPVFRAFKQNFPHKKTIGVFNPANLALFKTNPYIDTFLTFNGKWNAFFTTLKALKEAKPDIVFILHSNEPQATPLALLSGAKYIIKIPNDKNSFAPYHSNKRTATNLEKHGIFDRLKQLHYVDIHSEDPTLELFLEDGWKQSVLSFFETHHLRDPHTIRIGFQLGASTKSRMWFEEQWIALAKLLLQYNEHIRILLTGSPAEKALTAPIHEALKSDRVFDCAGLFSLGGAAALIGELDLLITPDTGPLHIATALKTPTIGLFAVADPKNSNACYDTDIHLFIKKPRTCEPCIAKRCTYQKCMLQITPIEVQQLIESIIKP